MEEQPLEIRESRTELVDRKRESGIMSPTEFDLGGERRMRKIRRNGGQETWVACGSGWEAWICETIYFLSSLGMEF